MTRLGHIPMIADTIGSKQRVRNFAVSLDVGLKAP
jgi:hypothetical protein